MKDKPKIFVFISTIYPQMTFEQWGYEQCFWVNIKDNVYNQPYTLFGSNWKGLLSCRGIFVDGDTWRLKHIMGVE